MDLDSLTAERGPVRSATTSTASPALPGRSGSGFLMRPHLKFPQAATAPQPWPPATDAIRPRAPTRLAECPELATGTVLHVHHSPV